MILNIDLLGLPCAEYCEHNGVKGIFIPEVPNFRYTPGSGPKKGGTPARGTIGLNLYKTKNASQRYDYMGRMNIWPEYRDAYLSNPNTVSRKRYIAYGYNWIAGQDETPGSASDADAFERLLED